MRAEIQTGLAKRKRRIWSAGAVAAIAILSLAAIFLVPGVHGPTNRAPVADQQPAAPRNVPDGALNLLKVDGTPRNDFDLDVSIVGNEPDDLGLISFVLNEEVQFEVEASRNCFITILGLSENSDPVRLFPDARFDSYRDAFLLAGQRRQLPSPPADDHISFEPIRATTLSTGPEALCVIGSNRPLELGEAESEGRYLFFRTPEQRDELYSRLRGFTRESQKSGKSISVRILPVYVRPQGTPVNTGG